MLLLKFSVKEVQFFTPCITSFVEDDEKNMDCFKTSKNTIILGVGSTLYDELRKAVILPWYFYWPTVCCAVLTVQQVTKKVWEILDMDAPPHYRLCDFKLVVTSTSTCISLKTNCVARVHAQTKDMSCHACTMIALMSLPI